MRCDAVNFQVECDELGRGREKEGGRVDAGRLGLDVIPPVAMLRGRVGFRKEAIPTGHNKAAVGMHLVHIGVRRLFRGKRH